MSSNYYRGLSPVVTEYRRFMNPCFFRKASAFSPLNCDSALEKLSEFCASHLGMPTKDIILQRSAHSRILFFTRQSWESLQQETKDKKNENRKNNNENITGEKSKQQEAQNYSYSHKYNIKNRTAKSLFANNQDMFLFSGAPIAAFLPPPLLPFPVEKIDLWTGVVDEYRPAQDEKFITLEEYIQIVESARKKLPQQEQQEPNENKPADTSSSELNNNNNNNKIQDLSGFLCVTRNQLSFVIADMGRNVLQGPQVSMKPITADSDRADTELLPHFQAEFWKNLSQDLLCSSSSSSPTSSEFFGRIGSLWFRSERELAVPFFMNCCIPLQDGKNDNQSEIQNVMELTKYQQLLRDDARWQRLPATVKSKKVPFDTDSLLRDSFYGQLQWYD